MSIEKLLASYEKKKLEIKERIEDFKKVWERQDNKEIFKELCYCILTANASARMGLRSMSALDDIIFTAGEKEISERLKGRHRFYNTRAIYIYQTRNNLMEKYNLDLISLIKSFGDDKLELRKFFAETKLIKGIGYKEASHFLRNIGIMGYAILDKHILNTMCQFNILCEKPKVLKCQKYVEIEIKLKNFSKTIGIDFDELDLLLWSEKTGEILK